MGKIKDLNGLKFKYLAFGKIEKDYKGISVWIDGKEVACGSIAEVLEKLTKENNLQDISTHEIVKIRPYFDLFVIELKS